MCFFITWKIESSSHYKMNSKVCFSRCEFLTKNRWNYGMFFISLWGMKFWQRTDEFIVCFSSVYGSVNFWQRMDGFYSSIYEFLTKNGWILWYVFHLFMVYMESMVTCNKCDTLSHLPLTPVKYMFIVLISAIDIFIWSLMGSIIKSMTFIWLNLHIQGLIMSYYGLKYKKI